MGAKVWGNAYRTTTVCVDSYDDGVLAGRFFNPYLDGGASFQSLPDFLVKMEALLDEMQLPQAHTATRSFGAPAGLPQDVPSAAGGSGGLATFRLQIVFRQHASWQGVVTWVEARREESFRSVLELILLLDSALRDSGGAARS